jgi:transcription initiation factor TFIIH subunit 2
MHVARRLTEETGGVYGVALSESHLEELILAHAPPPPALVRPRETHSTRVSLSF